MEQPLVMGPLNEGSGVSFIFYDKEYKIMFLAGRGDNTIGVYKFDKSSPNVLEQI